MPYHGHTRVDRDALSAAFAMVPRDISDDPDLTHTDRAVLTQLLWYAFREPHFPGVATLSSDLRLSDRHVRRIFRKLEALGWLQTRRRGPGATLDITIPAPQRRFPQAVENPTADRTSTSGHPDTHVPQDRTLVSALTGHQCPPSQDSEEISRRVQLYFSLRADGADPPAATRIAFNLGLPSQDPPPADAEILETDGKPHGWRDRRMNALHQAMLHAPTPFAEDFYARHITLLQARLYPPAAATAAFDITTRRPEVTAPAPPPGP